MTLPIDTVFVRHGQSEGNLAQRHAEAGKPDMQKLVTEGRHTRSYRLTRQGRRQAKLAGAWLREEFGFFDRYLVSDYARAMETAALLQIPSATWYVNTNLTERDSGEVGRRRGDDRDDALVEALRMRSTEPFYWRPLNGESFNDLNLRLDRVLATLHRECSDKKVVVVCHGEVMRGYRVLLERMPQPEFRKWYLSNEPLDRIHNCEIFHYTRRNPETHELTTHANWMRRIRPTDDPVWVSNWLEIERPRYTNEELMEIVDGYPPVLSE